MKEYLILFILSFLCFQSLAQRGLTGAMGAYSLSLGGSGVAFEGVDALFHNQAGIINPDKFSIQLSSERRFSLEELTAVAMGMTFNADKLGHFGFQISSFGFDLFSEQKIGLAYARSLSKTLKIGAQMDLLNTQIENFGTKTVYTFEIGFLSEIVKNLIIGAHVFNPMKIELSDNSEIPTRFRIGGRYKISDELLVYIEADKIIDRSVSIKSGISYNIIPELDLRAGVNTNPGIVSFGIAYNINSGFNIDGAYSYHEELGITPGISLKYKKE